MSVREDEDMSAQVIKVSSQEAADFEEQSRGVPARSRKHLSRLLGHAVFSPGWVRKPWNHPVVGYLAALLLPGLSAALVRRIFPTFSFPAALTIIAILGVALLWGTGPGLVATLVGTVLINIFVLTPRSDLGISSVQNAFETCLFLLMGITISFIISRIEQTRLEAATARSKAEELAERLVVEKEALRETQYYTRQALSALLAMAQLIGEEIGGGTEIDAYSPTGLTTGEIAQRLARLTADVLGCQRLSISVVEPETEILRPLTVVGLSPEQERQWWVEQSQQESRLTDNPDLPVVQRLQASEVVTLSMTEPPWNAYPNLYGVRTMLIAPMSIRGQVVGLITLDHGGVEHFFSPDEIELAGASAKLVTLVIERDRLLCQREQLRAEQTATKAREIALQETRERMDEFLGIASHELRTPLTTIKGNIQLAKMRLTYFARNLLDEDGTLQDGLTEIQMMLNRAERQVNVQNRLVRDLMDISRIQSGQLELHQEPCNLITIVHETVEDLQSATPARAIHVELPTEKTVPIYADAERIGQVISNYLTNAMKYSPEENAVDVRLAKEGKLARFSVSDRGPGLTSNEQERVWERFYRVEGIQRQRGFNLGLGLGLHICRSIIEDHQGTVGVKSKKGEGSTFWFTLPLAEEEYDL